MPAPPISPWGSQHVLFGVLEREVQRQLALVERSSLTYVNDPVVTLKFLGWDYISELSALAKRLKNLFDTADPHFDPNSDKLLSRRNGHFLVPNPQLFWQIPAFCEPSSQYIDVKRCLSRSADSNDPIAYNSEFWDSDELIRWASVGVSHILLVKGGYQCSDEIGEISTDLVRYLEEHDQPVVWIPYEMAIAPNFLHADDVLKQLAIQILQQNTNLHFDVHLPHLVKLFQVRPQDQLLTHWFDVLDFVLQGMTNVHMVIDLGTLETKYETASSWVTQFLGLFRRLRLQDSAVLKVVLLNTWPLPTGSPKPPTINIHSRNMPLHRRHLATRSEGIRSLPFPTYKSKMKVPQLAHSDEPSSSDIDPVTGEVSAAKGAANGPADWFTHMESFEELINASRKEPDDYHPRVKIAILDTGLDLSHLDIIKAKDEGRLKYWDFVDDTEAIKDDDGHGTHCTSIALQYAPNAEIFVGRVFRKRQADPGSCGILTMAIRHAAEKWKVNIISLSLGFTEDDDDLRAEIRSASAKILIFASAANNTINEMKPIRFPASMSEVICIFSSNSFGRKSDFNPPRRYQANLTFPGEKIKGAWPSTLTDAETFVWKGATYKHESGTSCSTPLAAAVAAGVLEFAWQERTPAVRRVNRLKHYTGMTEIFLKHMVDNYKVGEKSCHYVKPWKLISTSCIKAEIPVLISDALEKMNN
ncbi:peptidase S8/S53 domain-containing protein [Leptodontidium sp. MPI-SDFR-AT-0119]|nr:peptidase S8/S53 domain-containing protein [Leptodontidium sp. MPI-SDFR-AT-0119]